MKCRWIGNKRLVLNTHTIASQNLKGEENKVPYIPVSFQQHIHKFNLFVRPTELAQGPNEHNKP